MPIERPVVFVSHAATDVQIATRFKTDIERHFLGLCDVFVSSSLDSLNAGDEWVKMIKDNLSKSQILIGLLSPRAVSRGWVYFEFGAGWIRNIPVIPVCHSGLVRDMLVPPLSVFQAINMNDELHLSHLYSKIARALDCQVPSVSFPNLAREYHEATEVTRRRDVLRGWIQQLTEWNPEMKELISGQSPELEVMVPANLDQAIGEFMRITQERGLLLIERAGMALGTRVGPQASVFRFRPGPQIGELAGMLV